MRYREMNVSFDYSGPGEEILQRFVLPLLGAAKRYDRITSFFTVGSLIAISEGLDALRLTGGTMRLVIGIHDVPEELAKAALQSDDPTDALINGVRRRLLAQVATIRSELEAQRLSCIAWLLQDKLLEVRVAAPALSRLGPPGLFHNKAFVFQDELGDVVAGVGSANETSAGLGQNFEHLIAFTSWMNPEHTQGQVDYFQRLWEDDVAGVSVRKLDETFATELLASLRVQRPVKTSGPSVRELLQLASKMEPLALVAGKHAALFPHQERAFLDALSRWPVRVLLADEVGLGKTFETAAVVKHLLEYTDAKTALLLVPKAVLRQWQDELYEHFGIEAWLFESSTRTFVSPSGRTQRVATGQPVLSGASPPIVLMSAQYARGSRSGGSIATDATIWPDILVVDEAHAARVRADSSGSVRPTLMWHLVSKMCRKVPHVILATATPMQVHWREYFGLLEILGLPNAWRNPENYERSLRLISDESKPSLQDALTIGELIRGSVVEMKPSLRRLSVDERAFVTSLVEGAISSLGASMLVHGNWKVARSVLIKLHPAHLLTVRNTRSALTAVGYSFPDRNLSAPTLSVSEGVAAFYEGVERYLSTVYFSVERECFPDRTFNVGFVRSSYQQRLASSLHSCRLSLTRRRNKVQSLLESVSTGVASIEEEFDELLESEAFEDGDIFEPGAGGAVRAEQSSVARAARLEEQWLTDLLSVVEAILRRERDPKLECTTALLAEHLSAGDRVLVFSRYTDTLDAVLSECLEGATPIATPYGVYTGKECKIGKGRASKDCSRAELKRALETGDISVVFCSEAASEGLNLQSARVLINVDVPWNPARLEQRIGRIARLGQRAARVDIYNLWYPDSVESKMYKRLMERRDLYELAVGEFPEVVGAAIRDAVSARYGGQSADGADPIAELQRLRKSTQLLALKELWGQEIPGHTRTRQFREELAELVVSQARSQRLAVSTTGGRTKIGNGATAFSFTLESGEEDTISLGHPAMSLFSHSGVVDPSLKSLWAAAKPHLFALANSAGIHPLQPASLPTLVHALLAESDLSAILADSGNRCESVEDQQLSSWLASQGRLSVPTHPECPVPERKSFTFSELIVRDAKGSESVQ